MSQIWLAGLMWLDCAIIVDNEGIKIYFLPKKYEDLP